MLQGDPFGRLSKLVFPVLWFLLCRHGQTEFMILHMPLINSNLCLTARTNAFLKKLRQPIICCLLHASPSLWWTHAVGWYWSLWMIDNTPQNHRQLESFVSSWTWVCYWLAPAVNQNNANRALRANITLKQTDPMDLAINNFSSDLLAQYHAHAFL